MKIGLGRDEPFELCDPPLICGDPRVDASHELTFATTPRGSCLASEEISGTDIEPLLVALLAGVLDDHLERIAKIVDARLDALHAAEELIATSRLQIGQRVRVGHNVRPLYLHGRPGTITERHDQTWVVQLDEPVGRYTTGELRVRSTQLDPRPE